MRRLIGKFYLTLYIRCKEKHKFSYRILTKFLSLSARLSSLKGISSSLYQDLVVVSLTTYGKRLEDVYLTIESIMLGEYLPNKLILWLEDELEKNSLPIYLERQRRRGLEIRYTRDIRSYKKLIPTLKLYPEAIVITIDDDVFYHYRFLKNLLNSYADHPNHIHANRVHRIILDDEGKPEQYANWLWEVQETSASPLNMQTGVGGVLYPKHSLQAEVFNEAVFMDICQFGDDIWFYSMALMNGFTVFKAYTEDASGNDYIDMHNPKEEPLGVVNNGIENRNDIQIRDVFRHYDIYSLLNMIE